jgi:hypothetical protein
LRFQDFIFIIIILFMGIKITLSKKTLMIDFEIKYPEFYKV